MMTGDLPPPMVPPNNDVPPDSEDEEEAEAGGSGAGGAGAFGLPLLSSRGPAKLPLRLNSTLTLLALGTIEYVNPLFHNEQFLFPVGFRVSRVAATPASGGADALHVLEILRSPDAAGGPVFRITPEGGTPVQAGSVSAAWGRLFEGSPQAQLRALSTSAPKTFGLLHATVARLLQALPNAERCDAYCNWLGGLAPPVPPLVRARARVRALAPPTRLLPVPHSSRTSAAAPTGPPAAAPSAARLLPPLLTRRHLARPRPASLSDPRRARRRRRSAARWSSSSSGCRRASRRWRRAAPLPVRATCAARRRSTMETI